MPRPEDDPLCDLKLPAGAGAFVETRTAFSKWDEPMAALTGLRNRIAVCGVATECWVLSTILGAVDHGRFVRLVSDACARLSSRRRTGARNPRADGPRGEHG